MAGYLSKKGVYISATDAVSLSGYLKADASVPLTADWNVGAFDLTCVDMNATNFKLSGTGTLASTLGNVSLTTSLTAASGDEVGFYLPVTVAKAAGNYTAFKINATGTSAPGTTDYLMDLQVGGVSKAIINNDGRFITTSTNGYGYTGNANYWGFATTDYCYAQANRFFDFVVTTDTSVGPVFRFRGISTAIEMTSSSAAQTYFSIEPNVNQSLTGGYTGLKIDVTETSLGSGTNKLLTAQVGSVERFGISNKGFETRKYPLACTHDTATALFGIAVTAGNTAGGVITYTLNVTDDDGSDDQIEVGTVQFVGLQDEANWHTNISEVSTQAVESGTLATTWAIDTATANTLKVTLLANSDLTTPVYTLSYTVTFNNSYTVTTY